MSAISLTCTDLTDLVTDYLERELKPSRQLMFETHIVYCPGCRAFLGQIRETVKWLRAMPLGTVEEAERATLLDAYRRRTV